MAISWDIDPCQDTSERRVMDLTKVGISCVPVLGHTHYRRKWEDIEEHVHEGHLEITYCKSGMEKAAPNATTKTRQTPQQKRAKRHNAIDCRPLV